MPARMWCRNRLSNSPRSLPRRARNTSASFARPASNQIKPMIQEPAAHLLEHWKEFYLLIGTAAAALVELLFVAASIGDGILTSNASGPTRNEMSTVAIAFTTGQFVPGAALLPANTTPTIG